MIFAAPWILLALVGLPLLWWLLRVTPPAPRREVFPAVRLLLGLKAVAETPARTPWWLLLLRMVAAALVIVGLAGPVMDAGDRLPGGGPVLLVIDDGWASAADWPRRMASADAAVNRAERAGRPVALLATAPSDTDEAPRATVAMPATELRPRLAALRPKPWPVDRPAATAALRAWGRQGSVVYIADGLTDGADWSGFAQALAAVGPVSVLRDDIPAARLMLPPAQAAEQITVRVAQVPRPAPATVAVLAQSGDGRTLARLPVLLPAGAATGEAPLKLPLEIRNRLAGLTLEGQSSAGSVVLLDERWRRRPVGILAGDAATAETPLLGQAFYLRRALAPYTEVREGDLDTLLSRDLSVLVLADHVVADGPERDRLAAWVEKGGLLVRFAGPATAEHPDALLPVKLLAGDRQLGGALSWSQPAALAPFPPNSPFAGLTVPAEVRVNRQVLAEPGAHLTEQTWARLADGTPLVTAAPRGAGRIVLFHVTANADWSDLPLSGLFVEMLRRLVALSVGVANDATSSVPLAPAATLDGFGQLV
ncbi:MAG: BatA domain-containing protein, partial [Alphaproteobacteria bacterium]|nr:BatA domain-containing protein [Alphaproteobacteria bacterium]